MSDGTHTPDQIVWLKPILWRANKLHIRGPMVGGLYVCRHPKHPNMASSGMSPEAAYNAWFSYWGKMI